MQTAARIPAVVLLLRFFLVYFTSSWRKRITPLEPATLPMRVWLNDVDLNRHLNNGRYLSLMDLGRMDLLGRMRLLRPIFRRRWLPVLGAANIRFRRSLEPFEKFNLRTRVVCWDEKWFYMEQVFEKRDGSVAATAHVRGLFRGPEGNVAPSAIVGLLGTRLESPPMPELLQSIPW